MEEPAGRAAPRGEHRPAFTRRAVVTGRLDLSQALAVGRLVEADGASMGGD